MTLTAPAYDWCSSLMQLTQQGQHALGQLVCLGHHGGTGLLQNLRAAQVGGFRGKVSVGNAALSCREIFTVDA